MAKSLRFKREKRLRSIQREMVEPLYEKKDVAKLAAQKTTLAVPKFHVRPPPNITSMDVTTTASDATPSTTTTHPSRARRQGSPAGPNLLPYGDLSRPPPLDSAEAV